MGLLLYTPSIALDTVTEYSFLMIVIISGTISTAYTALASQLPFKCTVWYFKDVEVLLNLQGGIKAVVWTDVFQAIIMVLGILSVIIVVSSYNAELR